MEKPKIILICGIGVNIAAPLAQHGLDKTEGIKVMTPEEAELENINMDELYKYGKPVEISDEDKASRMIEYVKHMKLKEVAYAESVKPSKQEQRFNKQQNRLRQQWHGRNFKKR